MNGIDLTIAGIGSLFVRGTLEISFTEWDDCTLLSWGNYPKGEYLAFNGVRKIEVNKYDS